MSIDSLLSKLDQRVVTPVTRSEPAGVTDKSHIKQPCNLSYPCNPDCEVEQKPLLEKPRYADLAKVWRCAHEKYLSHLMACDFCYAPRGRYCPSGLVLKRVYMDSYESALLQSSVSGPGMKDYEKG